MDWFLFLYATPYCIVQFCEIRECFLCVFHGFQGMHRAKACCFVLVVNGLTRFFFVSFRLGFWVGLGEGGQKLTLFNWFLTKIEMTPKKVHTFCLHKHYEPAQLYYPIIPESIMPDFQPIDDLIWQSAGQIVVLFSSTKNYTIKYS